MSTSEEHQAAWKRLAVENIRFRIAMRAPLELEASFEQANEVRSQYGLEPLPMEMLEEIRRELPTIVRDMQSKLRPEFRADYSAELESGLGNS